MLQPWADFAGLDPVGVGAAITSPLCIGAAGVLVRKLASGGKPEHPQVCSQVLVPTLSASGPGLSVDNYLGMSAERHLSFLA